MTDDERREVARRLRSFVTDDSVNATVDVSHVLYVLGLHYVDIDRIYFCGYDVARLADLIEPSEPKARCVAEVKVDGERLEELAHDSAAELTGIDRELLLEVLDEMDITVKCAGPDVSRDYVENWANEVREALGVTDRADA